MRRVLLSLAAAAITSIGVAGADPITVSKTATVVSDPLNSPAPRSIPGALVDYTITFANPLANVGKPVRSLVVEDAIPATASLRVSDLGTAGGGPVVFVNGPVLAGIGDSGLSFTFGGLGDATDGIDFYNGTSWSYTPVPDANGCDPRVRAIRVRLLTTFKTAGQFSLRFRTRIK